MLVPMAKVEIIGPKTKFFDVVDLLRRRDKLHIEDLTKKISSEVRLDQMEVEWQVQAGAERERMEDLLIRVRAIIKALHLPGSTIDEVARQKEYLKLWKLESSELSDEVVKVIDEVEERTAGSLVAVRDRERDLAARPLRADPRTRSSRSRGRSSPPGRSTRSRCSSSAATRACSSS